MTLLRQPKAPILHFLNGKMMSLQQLLCLFCQTWLLLEFVVGLQFADHSFFIFLILRKQLLMLLGHPCSGGIFHFFDISIQTEESVQLR